jgi:hypothetical protein
MTYSILSALLAINAIRITHTVHKAKWLLEEAMTKKRMTDAVKVS